MKIYRRALITSLTLVILGAITFIFAYLSPPYQGSSGAGMAGLPMAFLMLASFIIMGIGGIIAAISVIAILLKSRLNPKI